MNAHFRYRLTSDRSVPKPRPHVEILQQSAYQSPEEIGGKGFAGGFDCGERLGNNERGEEDRKTDDAKMKIEVWRKDYNEHRPHSSLKDETPHAFAEDWQLYRTAKEAGILT